MPDSIKKLTELFSKFPTIGRRTAGRFVFYLINSTKQDVNQLVLAIQELKNNIKFCSFCFQPFELSNSENLCNICSDPSRNNQILCVVEKESDLTSIENAKKYKGLYFVLGGLSAASKNLGENLRIEQLKERIVNSQKFGLSLRAGLPSNSFKEVIIATNPTTEGNTTSVLVQRALKELSQFPSLKITHLGKGLPSGGELEYADQETLESAFEGRK